MTQNYCYWWLTSLNTVHMIRVDWSNSYNAAKFRCAPTRSVRNIAVENLCSRKSGPRVHQNLLRPSTNQWHSLCQILSRWAKQCTRKALENILQRSIFWLPRGPLDRSSPVSALMYSKERTNSVPNFVPF